MNRNSLHRFDLAPHETMKRSVFDLSHSHTFSFNVGQCIPTLVMEILPGDTISLKTSKVVRLQTMLDPIFGDMFIDDYYFFVPNRLVWTHWVNFMGQNDEGSWNNSQTVYSIPQLTSPASTGWNVGTIADYMSVPTGISGLSVNALPFRAYARIMNDWFRSEALLDPVDYTVDDTTVAGVNTGDQVTDIVKGGLPFNACKLPDYFTSCLPSPQRAVDTLLPLGNLAPVVTKDVSIFGSTPGQATAMEFRQLNNVSVSGYASGDVASGPAGVSAESGIWTNYVHGASPSGRLMVPDNIYADLSQATGSSVNQLRLAFQIQKMAELDARSGTRYIEKVKAHFGVVSADARQQRPEYLGGAIRQRLNINAVTQSSATGSTGTPQGHQTAYSVTGATHGDFSHSFTEHGYLIGITVCRYHHVYQQGLPRHFSRSDINSFYWPMLSNIGELPVLRKEIYATGNSTNDDAVFGYNEAWNEYRHIPNHVSGEMRSSASTSLDSWHLGDDYSSAPSLSGSWCQEDKSNVDRVLAVTSSVSNQLFGDYYFDIKATRVMPTYSIPGLIDHH